MNNGRDGGAPLDGSVRIDLTNPKMLDALVGRWDQLENGRIRPAGRLTGFCADEVPVCRGHAAV